MSPVTPLSWDSEFFGVSIGRTVVEEGDVGHALEKAHALGIQCLYVVIPNAHPAPLEDAVRRGGRLVDLRVTLELEGRVSRPVGTRVADDGDRRALIPLARSLAGSSRFSRDPRFPREAVAGMYEIWLEQCMQQGVVVVPSDAIRGFVGLASGAEGLSVELVYVDQESRGAGLAARLLRGALGSMDVRRAHVATQAWNLPAQRLYQELGFRTTTLQAIVHLWLDEAHQSLRAADETGEADDLSTASVSTISSTT